MFLVRNTGRSRCRLAIVAAIVLGEIDAALALDHMHASSLDHGVVMVNLIGLPILLALTAWASASLSAVTCRKARDDADQVVAAHTQEPDRSWG